MQNFQVLALKIMALAIIFANATIEQIEEALHQSKLPIYHITTPNTSLFVDTDEHQVLIDLGAGKRAPSTGKVVPNTQAAGIDPAEIEYVIINTSLNRPASIPKEMMDILIPLENAGQKMSHVEFPPLPPPPPGAFTQDWQVGWRDIEEDQTLSTATYLDYLLDFVLNAAAACGWNFERANQEGIATLVRRQWLRVVTPVYYGDVLKLSTWLSDVKRSRVTRHYTIHSMNDEAFIGQAHTLWVCIDLDTGKPVRIPASWSEDFRAQISVDNW